MAAHDESSAEPGIAEIGFYFGTGAFVTFVLVATLGLSILGHPSLLMHAMSGLRRLPSRPRPTNSEPGRKSTHGNVLHVTAQKAAGA